MVSGIKAGFKRFFAAFALLSVELIITFGLFIIALIGFVYVADLIFLRKKNAFDEKAFAYFGGWVSDGMSAFMKFITVLGTHNFLIPAYLILIAFFLFVKKHRWYAIRIPVVAVGGLSLMFVLKFLFNRPRPLIPLFETARGLSFPSGHALMSFGFYGLLCYIVYEYVQNKVLRWSLIVFLLIMILLIGISRIYLRVHYVSDVIAGFALGFIWLFLSIVVTKRIENYSRKEIAPVLEIKEPVQEPVSQKNTSV